MGSLVLLALFIVIGCNTAYSQSRRSPKTYVEGGMMIQADTTRVDSLAAALRPQVDSLGMDDATLHDSLYADQTDSLLMAEASAARTDSLSRPMPLKEGSPLHHTAAEELPKQPFFSDSMSLSKVCWLATVMPGYGQIYNKEYWKLPILYGAVGAGVALYVDENKTYKPLKAEYDALMLQSATSRSEELNSVQAAMIQSNTRRQLYLGAAIASYVYFLGDAAINYSTNEVSSVKKATTLSMICPGAGQIYNKSYWRVPIVVGLFATTLYVYDWNNRGYQRFNTAYKLVLDYENNPDDYPNGSLDEFGGAYSASYMKSLRSSYRRNRDLALILTGAAYLLQVLDAHVDAHLKDFDVSDDLTMNVEPMINSSYSHVTGSSSGVYGFNFNLRF